MVDAREQVNITGDGCQGASEYYRWWMPGSKRILQVMDAREQVNITGGGC